MSRASDEGHVDQVEMRAGRRFAEGQEHDTGIFARRSSLGRDAAQAAGTAVHRLLEHLALGAEAGESLADQERELEAHVRDLVTGKDVARAAERAREICERIRGNGMLERLANLDGHVVARELPVLVPPGEGGSVGDESPVAFVSGAIDLLYRDPETGEIVVADYKTDRVEDDEDVSERIEAYRAQGAAYVAAVQDALGLDGPPRFELWFLEAGRVEVVS